MNDEKGIFVRKIIKSNIKQPTRFGFSIEKWNEEWEKVRDTASSRDEKVYKAGCIIFSLLNEVREKVELLYQQAPKTTPERLMLAYAADSNRTTTVAIKLALDDSPSKIQSVKVQSGPTGNTFGLSEVAHGAVDGVQLAIRNCLSKIETNEKIKASVEPIDEMSFIQQELWLSQLYCSYEHLWQCILWSDYELIEQDKEQKLYIVKQPLNPFEIAFLSSVDRKSRLLVQNSLMASSPLIRSRFRDDMFVSVKRENKKRVAYVELVRDADEKLIHFNTQWRLDELNLQSHYPNDWFRTDYGQGFCLRDVLEVMRCLMLMSNVLKDKFPENDSAFNMNKLSEFCPKVQAFSLHQALCKATKIHAQQVANILEFLTIKPTGNNDLWCQPLIKISNNKYAILVSALSSPSIPRLVERWSSQCGIDLDKKGHTYEKAVVDELNAVLKENAFIVDYEEGLSKRVKLKTGEEEFDLLARVDDMIILGESKSIVTTDSEISKYRTAEILQHAGQQVNRKTKFLVENMASVFGVLGWNYEQNKEYKIAQCILNSGKVFVGHKFEGIPVIDESILCSYFSSNTINLCSVHSEGELKHISWYELYANLQELKDNFQTYISYPPQLSESEESYEYNEIGFPYINKESYKLANSYLVLKQAEPLARMDRPHHFRVIKSDDFDEQVETVSYWS